MVQVWLKWKWVREIIESEENMKRFSEKPRQRKLFSYYRRASHCFRCICKLTFHSTFWHLTNGYLLLLFIEFCTYTEPTFCLFLEFSWSVCVTLSTVPDHVPTWLEVKSLLKSTLQIPKAELLNSVQTGMSLCIPENHCKNENKTNARLDNSIFLFSHLFGYA